MLANDGQRKQECGGGYFLYSEIFANAYFEPAVCGYVFNYDMVVLLFAVRLLVRSWDSRAIRYDDPSQFSVVFHGVQTVECRERERVRDSEECVRDA